MSKPRFRALVLCAGLGTRLRPLSWWLPKPLLPIAGEPVVGHTLDSLRAAGCEAAVINLHHRPEDLPRALGRSYGGLALEYSHEEHIQGTCGALAPPRDLLAQSDAVVLVNGDSLCRWPLRKVLAHHFRRDADATLLLLPRAPESSLGGGIAIDAGGRVVQMRELEKGPGDIASRHGFAGLHVLSTRLLERVESRPGNIIEDLYQPLLQEGGRIETKILSRHARWHDLGTPGRYHAASLEALGARGMSAIFARRRRNSASPLATIAEGASIDRCLLDRGVRIGHGASLQDCVVLEGAQIGEHCRIRSSIIGPSVRLAPSSEVEKRLMTRHDKRHELAPSESQMGDLVYTPL